MTDGANSAGGWAAGAVPHRHPGGVAVSQSGMGAYTMLQKPRKAYLLLNVEPEYDVANASLAIEALKQAEYVMALSVFRNPILETHADVMLPAAPFTETGGTFINTAGEWQDFTGVASPYGSSRPAWKILRVLGNFLHLDGFAHESVEEVRAAVKSAVEKTSSMSKQTYQPEQQILAGMKRNDTKNNTKKLARIGEVPLYAVDGLVRRSTPLQAAQAVMEGETAALRLHPETALKLQVTADDVVNIRQEAGRARLTVVLDERIAPDAVWVAGGIEATSRLGDLFGDIEIEK